MADIVYTIGAKDTATQTFNRVGGSLDKLEKSTKDFASATKKSLGTVEVSIGSLLKSSGILYAVDKAVQIVTKSFGFLASGVTDFNAAEEALRGLDQAMELNGGSTEQAVSYYKDLADQIERTTNIAAEDTLALMQHAAGLGANNEELGNMATAAIGLSKVLGVSLETAMEKTRLATEGNFKAFEKTLPKLKDLKTDAEKLAAVQELAAKGFARVESESNEAGGSFGRLSTKIGDFAELIGSVLSPLVDTAVKSITSIVSVLTDALTPALEQNGTAFGEWVKWVQDKMVQVANGIIAAITMAEVVFTNFGDVFDLVKNVVALKLESIRADMAHLFGEVIPAYGSWLVTNFPRFFEDAFNAIITIVQNGAAKVANGFQALWDFIAGGGGSPGELVARIEQAVSGSLTEGFKSSIDALPEILGRSLTGKEQALQAAIGATANSLGDEFNKKFAERSIKAGEGLGKELSGLADEFGLGLAGAGGAGKAGKGGSATLSASESRLLTRGQVDTPTSLLKSIASGIEKLTTSAQKSEEAQLIAASAAAEMNNRDREKPTLNVARPPV